MATRSYISGVGSEDHGLMHGLAWLADHLAPEGATGVIVVPAADTLEVLESAVGQGVSKRRTFDLPVRNGVRPVQALLSSKMSFVRHDAALFLWLPVRDVEKVLNSVGGAAILAVGYIESEVVAYRDRFGMVSPMGASPAAAVDSRIETELRKLSRMVNLSSGISHPSDKAMFDAVILRLRASGVAIARDEVQRVLIENGWNAQHAATAADRAARDGA